MKTEYEWWEMAVDCMHRRVPRMYWKAFSLSEHKNIHPAACCDIRKRKIRISRMMNYAPEENQKGSMLHELVHLCFGISMHGNEFKERLNQIGGDYYACNTYECFQRVKNEYKRKKDPFVVD